MLGWKYDEAEEDSQRYKVGKYILETKMVCSTSNWEQELQIVGAGSNGDDAIEFDSQDEDECEDLFAGVWTPSLAAKRRQRRSFGRAVQGTSAETNARQH